MKKNIFSKFITLSLAIFCGIGTTLETFATSDTNNKPYWCTEGGEHHISEEGEIGWTSSYEIAVKKAKELIVQHGTGRYLPEQCECGLWTCDIIFDGCEEATGHKFSDWIITKEATCISEGIKTRTCSVCKKTETESIPKLEHKYITIVVNPTYFDQGYTLHKCSSCGNEYKDKYTAKLTLATVSNFKVTKTAYNAIKLGWNAVPNADGYIIWRYDFAKKQWIQINNNVKTNSFLFTHLNSGTKYRFAVRAYKKVNGKVITSPTFPVADGYTNLPTVSGFKVTATAHNAIKLGWNKVAGANGYYIYRYDYTKKQWKLINNKVKTNTFLFTHLNSGTNYKFAVRAYKTVDGKNILSQSFPVVETSTNPANVNFSLSSLPGNVNVKWNKVAGATGYKVYYKTSKNGNWSLLKTVNNNTTSYTRTGLDGGRTYYFTVKAYRVVNGKTYNGSFSTKSIKIKEIKAQSVNLNKSQITIQSGNSYSLIATVYPINTTDKITWTSSNSSVASIRIQGQTCIVTGKNRGIAIITVKAGSKKATCKVTVVGSETKIGQTLYNDRNCQIIYQGYEFNNSSFGYFAIKLQIINKTNLAICVQTRNESVNNLMTDFVFSQEIAPYKIANAKIKLMDYQMNYDGINRNNIRWLDFHFHYFDWNNWLDDVDTPYVHISF